MIKDEAQDEVVNSFGKNLIVSASAGSGKTSVMIRKIIKGIINDGIGVKDILVLTYTKASAEEMKQRLLNAIYENAENNPEILSQIDDIPVANISTIHSFFQKEIKKYFYVIGIDPSFVLIDELEIENLKAKALKEAMQQFYQEDSVSYIELLELYGNDRTDKSLQQVIKSIDEFVSSLADCEIWLNETSFFMYDDEKLVQKFLNSNLCFKINSFISDANKILKNSKNEDKYIQYANVIISMLNGISEKISFLDNYNNVLQISFPRLAKDEENYLYNEIIKLREKINTYKTSLKKMNLSEDNIKNYLEESKNIVKSVLNVYKKYNIIYENLKKELNCLDFNDLEKYMLKLITDEKTLKSLRNEFKQIYVDEYQDASLIQEKILNQLSNGKNRFMVGDVKQSIYAFRQANPEIFLGIQEKFSKDENSESKSLNSNFRSKYEILDFVNSVFDIIMTPLTTGIDYKNTSRFNPRAEYKDVCNSFASVNIEIIKRSEQKVLPQPPSIYSVKDVQIESQEEAIAESEARIVAEKISELLGQEIYDNKNVRKIDFKDITILLNARGKYLDKFCSTLSRFGIPVQANSREYLYSNNIIKILLNLLNLAVNVFDDVALASSLREFGEVSLNELCDIADVVGNNFYEKMLSYNADEKLTEKICKFTKMLEEFKFEIISNGIFVALTNILNNTKFLNKCNAKDKNNITKFVNDFLTNGYNYDLVGFLEFAENNLVIAPAYSFGNNSVNVTTIHSSKGLEYPVVFLVNCGADFTKSAGNSNLVLSEKYGLAIKEMPDDKPSLIYDILKSLQRKNEFAEKLRLLYVALTRAKNHLFIIGSVDKELKQINNDYDVFKQKSFLELVVGSLNQDCIKRINENKTYKNETFNIETYETINFSTNIKQNTVKGGGEELKNIFKVYFNYNYPFKKETNIALKNSVSRLVDEERGYSQNISPQDFYLKEHLKENASTIGIEYHSIMQQIDFNKNDLDVDIPENIDKIKILKAYEIIKELLNSTGSNKCLKEQGFMMYINQKEIIKDGCNEKILVQGIIDLLSLGKKNIIVDYKLSSILDNQKLIDKYKTQLYLYKLAVEKAFKIKIDDLYLYNFNKSELIKINI